MSRGVRRVRTLAALVAALIACAPGGIERVEYVDSAGRSHLVELPRGLTEEEVRARLGGPNAIQRGLVGDVVHWVYTYELARFVYVLEFRGGRLAYIHYQPRPGAAP